jgi:hypothetical protein
VSSTSVIRVLRIEEDCLQKIIEPIMGLTRRVQKHLVSSPRGTVNTTINIRGAQTAFILFSTFLDLRPVSAAHDVQTSINSR